MATKDELIQLIKEAFRGNRYPGDNCLRNSDQGDEPYLLEEEFKGKTNWEYLNSEFLDQAPDDFSTALSFFSDEAFHFYIPAYLIADIKEELESTDVAWYLCHDFEEDYRDKKIHGNQTWSDYGQKRFSTFSETEVKAVIAYLEFKKENYDEWDNSERKTVTQALDFYWKKRLMSTKVRKQKKKGKHAKGKK